MMNKIVSFCFVSICFLFFAQITFAQAVVTPTLYCLGSCQADTLEDEENENIAPTSSSYDDVMPTVFNEEEEENENEDAYQDEAVLEPCDSAVTIAHRKKHKHYGGMMRFLLNDLLEKLKEIFGLNSVILLLEDKESEPCLPVTPTPVFYQREEAATPTSIINEEAEEENESLQPTIGESQGNENSAFVKITFYGSWDNDPAGSLAIANPVIHDEAGGTGTYDDPLTFASPEGDGEYPFGQIIYVPLVQKYFIREDECAISWTAPEGCGDVDMVDLYVGNPSSDESVIACEESLTPSGETEIIIDPPSNLPVDASPIWDQSSGSCMSPH